MINSSQPRASYSQALPFLPSPYTTHHTQNPLVQPTSAAAAGADVAQSGDNAAAAGGLHLGAVPPQDFAWLLASLQHSLNLPSQQYPYMLQPSSSLPRAGRSQAAPLHLANPSPEPRTAPPLLPSPACVPQPAALARFLEARALPNRPAAAAAAAAALAPTRPTQLASGSGPGPGSGAGVLPAQKRLSAAPAPAAASESQSNWALMGVAPQYARVNSFQYESGQPPEDAAFAMQLSGKREYLPKDDTANYAFMLTLFMQLVVKNRLVHKFGRKPVMLQLTPSGRALGARMYQRAVADGKVTPLPEQRGSSEHSEGVDQDMPTRGQPPLAPPGGSAVAAGHTAPPTTTLAPSQAHAEIRSRALRLQELTQQISNTFDAEHTAPAGTDTHAGAGVPATYPAHHVYPPFSPSAVASTANVRAANPSDRSNSHTATFVGAAAVGAAAGSGQFGFAGAGPSHAAGHVAGLQKAGLQRAAACSGMRLVLGQAGFLTPDTGAEAGQQGGQGARKQMEFKGLAAGAGPLAKNEIENMAEVDGAVSSSSPLKRKQTASPEVKQQRRLRQQRQAKRKPVEVVTESDGQENDPRASDIIPAQAKAQVKPEKKASAVGRKQAKREVAQQAKVAVSSSSRSGRACMVPMRYDN
ncbi:MAG: hypothetical protein WDW38_000116 [Sanguina aurantia]